MIGLVDPDVRLRRQQLVAEHPHSASTVPWHQDAAHAPLQPAEFLRVDAEIGADAHPVPMTQGSVLAFSSLTFHHHGPNHSDHWRRAWIVQFGGSDTADHRPDQPVTGGAAVAVAERSIWIAPRSDLPSPVE